MTCSCVPVTSMGDEPFLVRVGERFVCGHGRAWRARLAKTPAGVTSDRCLRWVPVRGVRALVRRSS